MGKIRRKAEKDPWLWDEDLDWYFRVMDYMLGLRSPLASQMAALNEVAIGCGFIGESNRYTDRQAGWLASGAECQFRKGRRIWNILERIPWSARKTLREWYCLGVNCTIDYRKRIEEEAKAAHIEYYRARAHMLARR